MKDLFSAHAADYARYRPHYPQELYDFIRNWNPHPQHAWDCATGNGQIATEIAAFCGQVAATDISAGQLRNAVSAPNISYSMQAAEQTDFPDHTFDLITVGQAIHWFDFQRFYAECRRVAKPGALLVLCGYGLLTAGAGPDMVIRKLYDGVLGDYWEPERRYIDEAYRTIPFPFEEIACPHIRLTVSCSFEMLYGYLGTWSALKKFKRLNGYDPLVEMQGELQSAWGDDTREITWPIILKAGNI